MRKQQTAGSAPPFDLRGKSRLFRLPGQHIDDALETAAIAEQKQERLFDVLLKATSLEGVVMAHRFFEQVARPGIRFAPFPYFRAFEALHPIDSRLAAFTSLHHALVYLQAVISIRFLASVEVTNSAFAPGLPDPVRAPGRRHVSVSDVPAISGNLNSRDHWNICFAFFHSVEKCLSTNMGRARPLAR